MSPRSKCTARLAGVSLAALLVGSAVPEAIASSPQSGPDALPAVRLQLNDRYGVSKAVLEAAVAEMVRLFGSFGVSLVAGPAQGRMATGLESDAHPESRIEIKVILTSTLPEAWGAKRSTLGVTVPEPPPRRHVVVFPRRIKQQLGFEKIDETAPPTKAWALGRALGRVIAHEAIHALAPEHRHADEGVMLGTQNAVTLTRPSRIDDGCSLAVLEVLRRISIDL